MTDKPVPSIPEFLRNNGCIYTRNQMWDDVEEKEIRDLIRLHLEAIAKEIRKKYISSGGQIDIIEVATDYTNNNLK